MVRRDISILMELKQYLQKTSEKLMKMRKVFKVLKQAYFCLQGLLDNDSADFSCPAQYHCRLYIGNWTILIADICERREALTTWNIQSFGSTQFS